MGLKKRKIRTVLIYEKRDANIIGQIVKLDRFTVKSTTKKIRTKNDTIQKNGIQHTQKKLLSIITDEERDAKVLNNMHYLLNNG